MLNYKVCILALQVVEYDGNKVVIFMVFVVVVTVAVTDVVFESRRFRFRLVIFS